jgi:hypothetical protein
MLRDVLPGAEAQAATLTTEGTFHHITSHVHHANMKSCYVSRRGRPDGGTNPGNNLHVSGLHHKVDNNELESIFAKVGRVSFPSSYHILDANSNVFFSLILISCCRLKRRLSCTTHTPASREGSAS